MRSGKPLLSTLTLLALIPLFSGCIVPNKELMQLKSEVDLLKQSQSDLSASKRSMSSDLESRLNTLQSGIEASQKKASRSGADTEARIDSLKADFQHLSGRFEELKYVSEKSSSDTGAFLETAEGRMTALETKMAGMEKALSEMTAQFSALQLKLAAEEEEKQKEEALKKSPNAIYKVGLEAIKGGKPGEAREQFKQYLRDYPDGPLANNAQFWIGESYYDEKEYERAILEFEEVIKRYPQGGKVPAALLKQGMSFDQLKNTQTAQALYKKLIKEHPKSEEAKSAEKKIITPKKTP